MYEVLDLIVNTTKQKHANKNLPTESIMVAYTCNLNIQKARAEGLPRVQDHLLVRVL